MVRYQSWGLVGIVWMLTACGGTEFSSYEAIRDSSASVDDAMADTPVVGDADAKGAIPDTGVVVDDAATGEADTGKDASKPNVVDAAPVTTTSLCCVTYSCQQSGTYACESAASFSCTNGKACDTGACGVGDQCEVGECVGLIKVCQ